MRGKNKKGISPLIATVLIIGFTIVIAALVITWGTNLFKRTQESSGRTSEVSTACAELIIGLNVDVLNLYPAVGTERNMTLKVDNSGTRDMNGFMLRIYGKGETTAQSLDTSIAADAKSFFPAASFLIKGNGLQTYNVTLNTTLVPEAAKIELKPKVIYEGVPAQCPGEGTVKEVPKF
jgi:flagellin-like protein